LQNIGTCLKSIGQSGEANFTVVKNWTNENNLQLKKNWM